MVKLYKFLILRNQTWALWNKSQACIFNIQLHLGIYRAENIPVSHCFKEHWLVLKGEKANAPIETSVVPFGLLSMPLKVVIFV